MQETEQHLPTEWCNAVDENIQSGLSELWILSPLAKREMSTYERSLSGGVPVRYG